VKIGFSTAGWAELDAALDELGSELKSDVLHDALSKAAQPFLERARQLAPRANPSREPNPAKRLQASFKTSRKGSRLQRLVLSADGAARIVAGSTAPHAPLVEYGHRIVLGKRATTRAGRKSQNRAIHGTVPPHPFLRPAWDATRDQVVASIKDQIAIALEKKIRVLGSRARAGTLSRTEARKILG
jgi:HK97 gp10 family phage protein